MAGGDAAGATTLWEIAPPAGQPRGFLLGPAGYQAYKNDPVYVVGRSSPAADWPYIHPGPDDAWAGSRPHTFTVAFSLGDRVPGGSYVLHVGLADEHDVDPPHLVVAVNDAAAAAGADVPAGGGGSAGGDRSHARPAAVAVPLPAGSLHAGLNVLRLRTDRGSWMLYDRVSLTGPAGATSPPVSAVTLVTPRAVRGLTDRGQGTLGQPVEVALYRAGPPVTAAVSLGDGPPLSVRLAGGGATATLETAPVDVPRQVDVRVAVPGEPTVVSPVTVRPVRHVTVYVLNHSHTDIGYTDVQANVERKQMRNLQLGMALADRTAAYPPGARFVWNLEVLWAADLYQRRMTPAQQARFLQAVRDGHVALNGMFANTLTGLCRPEDLLQLFRLGTRLGEQTGVPVDSAMLSDVPGFTWGTVTAMHQAGIRYFSAAPNYFDRIGTIMTAWQDKPAWLVGPDGHDRVLVWTPWEGYAMSHIAGRFDDHLIDAYLGRLDAVNYPYDISYVRWAGHGDNGEPDPAVPEAVQAWARAYAWPKFVIASTHDALSAMDARYGKDLPVVRGDLTPYWEDGAGSSAAETALSRNTSDHLVQAQALFAMRAPGQYPVAAFTDAWRDVLLYNEHTWGAWDSVSDPERPTVHEQWAYKRAFVTDGQRAAAELLAAAAAPAAPTTAPAVAAFDLTNTTSWPRTELVRLSPERSAAGDGVRDPAGRAVPSQRLADGTLAAWVADVPALAAERYAVTAGPATVPPTPVTIAADTLDNGRVRLRVDPATGDVVELRRAGDDHNYAAGGLNRFTFFEGGDAAKLQPSGPVAVTVVDAGPLVATLRVDGPAPGCNGLSRTVSLTAGADFATLADTVDKRRSPANPRPGGGPGQDFPQRGGKESLSFAFPFDVPGGQVRLDEPLSVVRPDQDQLPGSCRDWLPVGRWADVSGDGRGVTLATLDAPLVEIGRLSSLLGSQHDTAVWRREVGPSRLIYSWVMNNHWSTNYRAYQEGASTFRYALRPHAGYDGAAATRFSVGLSQPLLAGPAVGPAPSATPLLSVGGDDGVLVIDLKPSDDGRAFIVRLYNASPSEQRPTLAWAGPAAPQMWVSDLSEAEGRPLAGPVTIPPAGLVTVLVARP